MADVAIPPEVAFVLSRLLNGTGNGLYVDAIAAQDDQRAVDDHDVRSAIASAWHTHIGEEDRAAVRSWALSNRGALLRLAMGLVMGARG